MGEQHPRRDAMCVLIVDDEPRFRLGVATALVGDERLEYILCEAGDGEAVLGTPDLPRRADASLCFVAARLDVLLEAVALRRAGLTGLF